MENYYSVKKEQPPSSSASATINKIVEEQQYQFVHHQFENNDSPLIPAAHHLNDGNFFNHKEFIDYYNCKSKYLIAATIIIRRGLSYLKIKLFYPVIKLFK